MNIIEFIFEVFGIPYTYIAITVFIFCAAVIILGILLTTIGVIKNRRKKRTKKNKITIK